MEILGRGRPSARVGSDVASTPPRSSLYLSAPSRPPHLRSLSCPLTAAEHHAVTIASFLHPSRPCCLLPQFVQCLPGLFLSPTLSGCVADACRRRYPCRWRLGAGVEAPQVVSSEPRGTHERGRCWWCSHATGSIPP
jgi:hypothetical protein